MAVYRGLPLFLISLNDLFSIKKVKGLEINPLLLPYVPLVEYFGQAFGESCEVILHDLTNIEHSIVAIANGHITNRQVGGHITDFGLEVVHDPQYQDKPFAVNYPGSAPDRNRILKSSTFFIRDKSGTTIGLFCLNQDITDWINAGNLIKQFTRFSTVPEPEKAPVSPVLPMVQETFSASVEDTMNNAIERIMADYPVPSQRLTIDEKKRIVERLHARGLFVLKGAVGMVAKRLDVSEQTIYRYLREVQSLRQEQPPLSDPTLPIP